MDRRPRTEDSGLKTARIFDARFGQTAMEYLLILVIAIAVVVAIMVWMQASQTEISGRTGEQVNAIQCALQDCVPGATPDQCNGVGYCPTGGTCNSGTHKCEMP